MRNLTRQELNAIIEGNGNEVETPELCEEIKKEGRLDIAFFSLDGEFLTFSLRKARKKFKGETIIYGNLPAAQGRSATYTF